MRILAFDTAQLQAAACILDGEILTSSGSGDVSVAHSEGLMLLLDRLLLSGGTELKSFEAIAVGVGPGSFTGIRIGCSTAKALAQVLGIPVLPFSSLRALAYSAPGAVAMINAYQGEVFAGWQAADGKWREAAVSAAEWCRGELPGMARAVGQVRFCGTGAAAYWGAIAGEAAKLGLDSEGVRLHEDRPFATPEGVRAAVSFATPVRYVDLHANYVRSSQAEIKLQGRLAKATDG